jgi:hypothetical protein
MDCIVAVLYYQSIMSAQETGVQPPAGTEKARRSDRILAPIPIRVIGSDVSGVGFSEDTSTVSFNKHGASISLTHALIPDDVILILNKRTNIEEEFRVVGALQHVFGERSEWGAEAMNAESGIWGVEFTPPPEGTQPKALIECGACLTVIHSPMFSIEYEVLLVTGLISRHCDRCGETTRWRPSQQTDLPEMVTEARKAPAPSTDRRKARRLKLVMRVRARNNWGVTDVAQTRDVSKAGLCFLTPKLFTVGEEIHMILPFAANSVPVESKAKVIWSNLAEGSPARYYGVVYMK